MIFLPHKKKLAQERKWHFTILLHFYELEILLGKEMFTVVNPVLMTYFGKKNWSKWLLPTDFSFKTSCPSYCAQLHRRRNINWFGRKSTSVFNGGIAVCHFNVDAKQQCGCGATTSRTELLWVNNLCFVTNPFADVFDWLLVLRSWCFCAQLMSHPDTLFTWS